MKSDLEILINEICQYRTDETIILTLELLRKHDLEQQSPLRYFFNFNSTFCNIRQFKQIIINSKSV